MDNLKQAIKHAVWNDKKCNSWFLDGNSAPLSESIVINEIHHVPNSTSYRTHFVINGNIKVTLNEQSFYKTFYANENIYKIAGKPMCILLDIALSKGGPEAIAESFYNAMRHQQIPGGQSNDTLVSRTKVCWCLPSIPKCEQLIKLAAKHYVDGDDKMKGHREKTFFTSARTKTYDVSKVVDRVNDESGRCPFLTTR